MPLNSCQSSKPSRSPSSRAHCPPPFRSSLFSLIHPEEMWQTLSLSFNFFYQIVQTDLDTGRQSFSLRERLALLGMATASNDLFHSSRPHPSWALKGHLQDLLPPIKYPCLSLLHTTHPNITQTPVLPVPLKYQVDRNGRLSPMQPGRLPPASR
jgi:hypothetical protein